MVVVAVVVVVVVTVFIRRLLDVLVCLISSFDTQCNRPSIHSENNSEQREEKKKRVHTKMPSRILIMRNAKCITREQVCSLIKSFLLLLFDAVVVRRSLSECWEKH